MHGIKLDHDIKLCIYRYTSQVGRKIKVKLTAMFVHPVSDKAPNRYQNCYSQTRYYQHCNKHTVVKSCSNLTALCTYNYIGARITCMKYSISISIYMHN